MPMPCSDHAVLLKDTAQHGRRETTVLCCGLEKNGMVGVWHGMASVNQTRPHYVNQMGKTHSKPLAAWHVRGNCMGAAWERHAMCESILILSFKATPTRNLIPAVKLLFDIQKGRVSNIPETPKILKLFATFFSSSTKILK